MTPDVQAKILQAVRGGSFREVAAQWAGISPERLSKWLAHPAAPYQAFRQAILAAEQEAEIAAVAKIIQAGQTDPKHLEWWLERKFPERWGRRDRIEITVRQQAEKLAAELGLSVDEIMDEAERIVGLSQ
jgi:phage antirepressor YoqD-like protein